MARRRPSKSSAMKERHDGSLTPDGGAVKAEECWDSAENAQHHGAETGHTFSAQKPNPTDQASSPYEPKIQRRRSISLSSSESSSTTNGKDQIERNGESKTSLKKQVGKTRRKTSNGRGARGGLPGKAKGLKSVGNSRRRGVLGYRSKQPTSLKQAVQAGGVFKSKLPAKSARRGLGIFSPSLEQHKHERVVTPSSHTPGLKHQSQSERRPTSPCEQAELRRKSTTAADVLALFQRNKDSDKMSPPKQRLRLTSKRQAEPKNNDALNVVESIEPAEESDETSPELEAAQEILEIFRTMAEEDAEENAWLKDWGVDSRSKAKPKNAKGVSGWEKIRTIESTREAIEEKLRGGHVMILQKTPPTECELKPSQCAFKDCLSNDKRTPEGAYRISLEPESNLYLNRVPDDPAKKGRAAGQGTHGATWYCLVCVEAIWNSNERPVRPKIYLRFKSIQEPTPEDSEYSSESDRDVDFLPEVPFTQSAKSKGKMRMQDTSEGPVDSPSKWKGKERVRDVADEPVEQPSKWKGRERMQDMSEEPLEPLPKWKGEGKMQDASEEPLEPLSNWKGKERMQDRAEEPVGSTSKSKGKETMRDTPEKAVAQSSKWKRKQKMQEPSEGPSKAPSKSEGKKRKQYTPDSDEPTETGRSPKYRKSARESVEVKKRPIIRLRLPPPPETGESSRQGAANGRQRRSATRGSKPSPVRDEVDKASTLEQSPAPKRKRGEDDEEQDASMESSSDESDDSSADEMVGPAPKRLRLSAPAPDPERALKTREVSAGSDRMESTFQSLYSSILPETRNHESEYFTLSAPQHAALAKWKAAIKRREMFEEENNRAFMADADLTMAYDTESKEAWLDDVPTAADGPVRGCMEIGGAIVELSHAEVARRDLSIVMGLLDERVQVELDKEGWAPKPLDKNAPRLSFVVKTETDAERSISSVPVAGAAKAAESSSDEMTSGSDDEEDLGEARALY